MNEDKRIEELRRCLQAEIRFRKRLIDDYLMGEVQVEDLMELWKELDRKFSGDKCLHPGGDNWTQVRTEDLLRDYNCWDEERLHPDFSQKPTEETVWSPEE